MTTRHINPFQELYLTESIAPDRFVPLFSPFFVNHALSLFQPGNVVLMGLPGSGKSMLLNLLKPEIRMAYVKADVEFPVPKKLSNFISAGINLTQSGVVDFGQRPFGTPDSKETDVFPIYFGDFLNYWVVADILKSVDLLISANNIEPNPIVTADRSLLDDFARKLALDDVWFGYLDTINSFVTLREKISKRVTNYRRFLNYNEPVLFEGIRGTKTSVGEPISRTAEHLREMGIISPDTQVYVQIDQYESLTSLGAPDGKLGELYQQVIHKALGMRDPRVSYRIGARPYSWQGKRTIYGSTTSLEASRDYLIVDIDEKLLRKENRRTWIFPQFAEEIFERRIAPTTSHLQDQKSDALTKMFGAGLGPVEKAKSYAGQSGTNILRLISTWPEPWIQFLKTLANEDPFSARLAEAWAKQRGKETIVNDVPVVKPYPWENKNKKYWRKERTEQSLMQIASRNRQRMIWTGKDDILALSGGNILVFLGLCQHIWDVWIRDMRGQIIDETTLPEIDTQVQSAGILEASAHWFEKISVNEGGNERRQFVQYLGNLFYNDLVHDESLSYPGHNGFSLSIDELVANREIDQFLANCVAYGDLHEAPHTPKTKGGSLRRKWYLNPVLSPYFKIPYIHTKEPMYVSVQQVHEWLAKSRVLPRQAMSTTSTKPPAIDDKQLSFFYRNNKNK